MARENEADRRPRAAPGGSFSGSSATTFPAIAHKLLVTVAGGTSTFTIRTLDGVSTSLGTLQVGNYVFNVQCDQYTAGTPANVTVVGLYHL